MEELYRQKGPRFLLDVREPVYFLRGHIPGAYSIPLPELVDRLGEIPRDRPVYVVCRAGFQSRVAARLLGRAGFSPVYVVEGGVTAWVARGYPVERGGP